MKMVGYMSAGRFSPEVLEQIRQRVSLYDVVSRHAQGLKKKGNDWWACCPFHHEKSPSFHLHENKGYYHCFGCGAHGNVFDFIKEVRGGSFVDAVVYLGEMSGIDVQFEAYDEVEQKKRQDGFEVLEKTTSFYEKNLKTSKSDYFEKRGLTPETIKTFRLGLALPEWSTLTDHLMQQNFSKEILVEANVASVSEKKKSLFDRFRDRVMFPIESVDGKVVGFGGRVLSKDQDPKYLNSSESKFFNKRYMLYNLNRAREFIRKENTAIVVEGYMDVIGLWNHGVKTAVAPMGTAITEDQVRLLWRFYESPIVCLDGDRAGRGAAVRIAKRILSALEPGKTLKFVWMPDGEDPDTYIKAFGKEGFEKILAQPSSLEDVLWQDMIEGRDISSGDGRAAIENDIDELMKQVGHDTIRKHYTRSLKDRLWRGGRKEPEVARLNSNTKAKNILSEDKQAHILLSILFRKIDLFEKVYEKVSSIQVKDPDLESFKKVIFKLFLNGTLEKDSLESYFASTGMLNRMRELLSSTLVAQTKEDDLEELWFKLYDELERADLLKQTKREKVDVNGFFNTDSTLNTWEKAKAAHKKSLK
jgi:DNA primase